MIDQDSLLFILRASILYPPCPALGSVHLQPQMLVEPALDRRHGPFRRRLSAYVDIAVPIATAYR